PPSVPAGLALSIDGKGGVDLTWQANQDADLRGYQLAIARFPDDEFVPVTSLPITTTNFSDTLALNFLNREIYYQIAALDQSGNLSQYSAPVVGLLPDTIKPLRPYLEDLKQQGDTLTLTWQPLGDEDLAYLEILVRRNAAATWQPPIRITSFTAFKFSGIDTLAGDWAYAIRAIDEAGNQSPLSNIRVFKGERQVEIAAPQFPDMTRVSNEQVELNWSYPQKQARVSFLVFSLPAGGDAPTLLARTQEQFLRLQVPEKETVQAYFVVAQDNESGQYSGPSALVSDQP
ncbi:MAG: hypothetical protein AAF597_17210, partial [Bacteroidota bacterium]